MSAQYKARADYLLSLNPNIAEEILLLFGRCPGHFVSMEHVKQRTLWRAKVDKYLGERYGVECSASKNPNAAPTSLAFGVMYMINDMYKALS